VASVVVVGAPSSLGRSERRREEEGDDRPGRASSFQREEVEVGRPSCGSGLVAQPVPQLQLLSARASPRGTVPFNVFRKIPGTQK
jgi:hypothetical protein